MDLILKSLVLLSCQYSNWMAFCFNLDEMNLCKSHFHCRYNGIKPRLPLIYFEWMHIFRAKIHQLLAHKLENMDFHWWFLTQFFILFSRVVSHAFTLFLIRNICINELALSLGAHSHVQQQLIICSLTCLVNAIPMCYCCCCCYHCRRLCCRCVAISFNCVV